MKRDLEGRTILLTRSEAESLAWAEALRARGATAHVYACFETHTLRAAADQARAALQDASWIAFSSARAVAALAELCPAPWSNAPRLACIGHATETRCKELIGEPELVSREQTGLAFAQELCERCQPEERILLPAARDGRRDFEQVFPASALLRVSIYETITVEDCTAPPAHDAIFFSSPSAVAGFAGRAGQPLPGTLLVAIGPTTAEALAAAGWGPVAISSSRELDGMLQAAHGHWKGQHVNEPPPHRTH